MRLTIALFQRRWPKSSFRRPMIGRNYGREKPYKAWSMWYGEIDEEKTINGRKVPVCEKIPMIMVPDMKDCDLKPYVAYQCEKHHENPMQAKDLFDVFYAPETEARMSKLKMEQLPNVNEESAFTRFLPNFLKQKSQN